MQNSCACRCACQGLVSACPWGLPRVVLAKMWKRCSLCSGSSIWNFLRIVLASVGDGQNYPGGPQDYFSQVLPIVKTIPGVPKSSFGKCWRSSKLPLGRPTLFFVCESHIFSLRQGGGGGCVGPSRLSLLAAGPHMPPPPSQGEIYDSPYASLDNSVVWCHPHVLDRYFPLQPEVCSLIWELSY